MGGDHKLERADPMVQCEVQAHKSTALEFNQHLVGAIFHMVRYARYFDRKRRFSANIAPAKSISRLDLRRRCDVGPIGPDFTARGPQRGGGKGPLRRPSPKNEMCRLGVIKRSGSSAEDGRANPAVKK